MGRLGRKVANAFANTLILFVVLIVGLLGLEFASRGLFLLPTKTLFLDADENVINIYSSPTQLIPDISYRQVSPDFDVLTRIGPMGLRGPEPKSDPEIIFLGDSFTFGQGLEENQTFPAIFCAEMNAVCANLGLSGTGTFAQASILENWLEKEDWRPTEVKHFVFAMSSAIAGGNDLFDTVVEINTAQVEGYDAAAKVPGRGGGVDGTLRAIASFRGWVLINSNLARIGVLQFGPTLRAWFSPGTSQLDLADGIEAMNSQIERVHALSEARGFRYTIYVIHPMQDLIRGSHDQTADAVRQAADGFAPVIDTAPALLDDPANFYFPYDGHINAEGARRIAEFLLNQN